MNTSRKSVAALSFAIAALAITPSFAQGKAPADATPSAAASKVGSEARADMTNGEVRKVDKEGGKVTLKHEAIKNVDMPGMTMVFKVKDAALLDAVKAGDKVKFRVISEGGGYIVTDLVPAK